jgi:hypothetical protein
MPQRVQTNITWDNSTYLPTNLVRFLAYLKVIDTRTEVLVVRNRTGSKHSLFLSNETLINNYRYHYNHDHDH